MIKELIKDLAFDKIKLSQAIMRAKVIESQIKNETLRKWLHCELNGYIFGDEKLPPYRTIQCPTFLQVEYPFGKTQRIHVDLSEEDFDKDIVHMVNYLDIIEPISSVENQINNIGAKALGYIKIPTNLTTSIANLYSDHLSETNGVARFAEREVAKIFYQNVLDHTKNKLLDMLIELNNEFPNLSDNFKDNPENNDKVQNIVTNNIYGNNNPMNIATGIEVKQNSTITLIAHKVKEELKELGVSENEIGEINTIVSDQQSDSSTRTSKILKWLSSVSASLVARGLYENIPKLTDIIERIQ